MRFVKNSLIRLARQQLNPPPAGVGALLGPTIPPLSSQNHHYPLPSSHPIHSRTFSHAINDPDPKPKPNPRPKELPEWVSPSVMVLSCDSSSAEDGTCHVYVVGSRHCSPKSCMEVEAVMGCVKPQAVFLDLCSDREELLTMEKSEFRVASEEPESMGASFPFSAETFMRVKNGWDDDFRNISIQVLGKEFPSLLETLVNERDQYMSSKLLEVASTSSSVVVVVGRAHLPGIKKHWKQPIEMEHLLEVPSSPWAKLKFFAFRPLVPFLWFCVLAQDNSQRIISGVD
ncbi:hypothetical protein Tsubulata_002630 [Turnera subulata]|uniref:Uncharacterized protein n=1 Tax=Turnera subulata TaxID=218843 RepID=A0A9Q0FKV8_9ROSI|nr:hypothetical protein Tsubulata_002630 [Turnera subulata]